MINGEGGELFVQKAPSATIGLLSKVLHKIFDKPINENIIGERHGEKLYESLLSREERINALEDKKFFCVPIDERDLNYESFFREGTLNQNEWTDYNSHTTEKLLEDELEKKLLSLEIVRSFL